MQERIRIQLQKINAHYLKYRYFVIVFSRDFDNVDNLVYLLLFTAFIIVQCSYYYLVFTIQFYDFIYLLVLIRSVLMYLWVFSIRYITRFSSKVLYMPESNAQVLPICVTNGTRFSVALDNAWYHSVQKRGAVG